MSDYDESSSSGSGTQRGEEIGSTSSSLESRQHTAVDASGAGEADCRDGSEMARVAKMPQVRHIIPRSRPPALRSDCTRTDKPNDKSLVLKNEFEGAIQEALEAIGRGSLFTDEWVEFTPTAGPSNTTVLGLSVETAPSELKAGDDASSDNPATRATETYVLRLSPGRVWVDHRGHRDIVFLDTQNYPYERAVMNTKHEGGTGIQSWADEGSFDQAECIDQLFDRPEGYEGTIFLGKYEHVTADGTLPTPFKLFPGISKQDALNSAPTTRGMSVGLIATLSVIYQYDSSAQDLEAEGEGT